MFEYLLRRLGFKKKPQSQTEEKIEFPHPEKIVKPLAIKKASFTTRLPPNPRPAPQARPKSDRRTDTDDTPVTQNDGLAWAFVASQSSEPARESTCSRSDESSSSSDSDSNSSSCSYSGE